MPPTRLQRGEPVGQCEEVPGPRWRKARSVNSQRGQQRRAEERNTSDGKGVASDWRRTHPGDTQVPDTGAQGDKMPPPPTAVDTAAESETI